MTTQNDTEHFVVTIGINRVHRERSMSGLTPVMDRIVDEVVHVVTKASTLTDAVNKGIRILNLELPEEGIAYPTPGIPS